MSNLTAASRAEGTGQRAVSWAPLAVILCGTFVYVLDFFIVNVAALTFIMPRARLATDAGGASASVSVGQRAVPAGER
jgi:hypothetical protein